MSKILQRILLLSFSVILALIASEVLLGVFYHRKDILCVFPPNLHYEFQPDSTIIYGVHGRKNFDTDRMGIRRFDTDDPDDYEILFIGGSTTECIYLDDKQTWPYLLAKKLKLKGGSIGKSGQTSFDHYMQMKYFLPQLKKVKTVVVMCGLNDVLKILSNIDSPKAEMDEKLYLSECFTHTNRFASSKGLKLKQVLHDVYRSQKPDTTGQAIQDVHGACYSDWRGHRQAASEIITEARMTDPLSSDYYQSDVAAKCAANVYAMIKEAKRQNTNIVFIGQTYSWRDSMTAADQARLWMGGKGNFQNEKGHPYYSTKLLDEWMRHFNSIVQLACTQEGVKFIDLSSFPADVTHLYDDCHFTERGARELADSIYAHWEH